MKTNFLFRFALICLMVFALLSCKTSTKLKPEIPHLKKQGTATQLMVDGKPFFILGGELENSSASSLEYMKPYWPVIQKTNLNTVLATISWEQFEPTEGKFDFTLVDGLIKDAREHNLRLLLLWFGSWKNGNSRYAADWVKADQKRFPKVLNKNGKTLEILSVFGEETCKADARAFAALMKHVREVDSEKQTVLMMQVQNEVGVHRDSRDRSALANEAFAKPVPKELMDYLQKNKEKLLPEFLKVWETTGFKTSGTWEEVFGKSVATDEIFMAWNYARYINRVVEAGKAEYSIPMFVNAWLVQPQDKTPGDYPSGGPVAQVHDIWRAGGPQIDILSPDVHLRQCDSILTSYSRGGNPVFIPESYSGKQGAANAFLALGKYGAIGYSPFGIEDKKNENVPLSKAYAVLSQLSPLIAEHQGNGTMSAALLKPGMANPHIKLGNYTIQVELRKTRGSKVLPDIGYGIFIAVAPNEYIIAANDIEVTFLPNSSDSIAGLMLVEEGKFANGKWIPERRLNGDEVQLRYDLDVAATERQSGAGLCFLPEKYSIQRVKLYNYK